MLLLISNLINTFKFSKVVGQTNLWYLQDMNQLVNTVSLFNYYFLRPVCQHALTE